MRTLLLLFCATLLTTACGTLPKLISGLQIEQAPPQPVVAKCVKPEDIPAIPLTAMQPDGDILQDANGASADARALRLTAKQLRAALLKCATQGSGP